MPKGAFFCIISCMKTLLYYAELTALHDEELFRQYYQTLPEYRKKKIDKLKPEGERCRSLGAGLLLKRACEDAGIPGEDGHLSLGEYGKPSFAACPEIHFSLSHSGEYAVCVMAPCETGCDIETVKPFREAVAKRVFTGEEYLWLSGEKKAGRGDEAFCRLWTLKESFLKVTGKGFSFPVQEAGFSFAEGPPVLLLHGQPELSCSFFELQFSPEYRCAVCLQSRNAMQPEVIQVRF